MMVMLVLFIQMNEFFLAHWCFHCVDLCFGKVEYFLSLQAVIAIFYIFPVFHHPVDIISYPLLFLIQSGSAHITKQLILGKLAKVILANLDAIFLNHFI